MLSLTICWRFMIHLMSKYFLNWANIQLWFNLLFLFTQWKRKLKLNSGTLFLRNQAIKTIKYPLLISVQWRPSLFLLKEVINIVLGENILTDTFDLLNYINWFSWYFLHLVHFPICDELCPGRCYDSTIVGCCHPECAVGCTGPSNSDCLVSQICWIGIFLFYFF